MAKVRILSDRVANQIAAGEVIERPAAVVKELVENALDAGASRVAVHFANAGRSLIRVEDNGHGMPPEDARTALERHATSKISDSSDLDRLSTYGFRGEALPSIASVSRFTLRTREKGQDSGVEIVINAGRIMHEKACGCPVGTRIDVEHLFEPVPARRKLLKSDRTEAGHIVNCVRLYALACPKVAFELHEDGREVFRSPQCPGLSERVAEIFGRQAAEGLLPIESSEQGMRLSGLIGRPGVGRATRHDLVAFVNSRPVDSKTLSGALIESYRESLPQGRFPVAFVFLECDSAEVDVNVHPAKREVRFRRDSAVRAFVIRTVLERMRELAGQTAANWPVTSPVQLGAPGALPAPFHGWAGERAQDPVQISPSGSNVAVSIDSDDRHEMTLGWRFLGTAHGSYALFEVAHGLVLLDRRAAHERIWYERLKGQFSEGKVPVQHLLLTITIELNPVASAVLTDNLAFLRGHGIEVSEFGKNFFVVEALPDWMEPGDADGFIRDLIGAAREGRLPVSDLDAARDEFARLASSRAVRLPSETSEAEALSLVRELFSTSSPISSPSGHPTFVELNHGELARRFQK
jgi:DNA mismatch repair protein MutL